MGDSRLANVGSGDSRTRSKWLWNRNRCVCDVVNCIGPLTASEFRKNAKKAGTSRSDATLGYYKKTYAWVIKTPRRLKRPVPYEHPSGEVIWVLLNPRVEKKINAQLGNGK